MSVVKVYMTALRFIDPEQGGEREICAEAPLRYHVVHWLAGCIVKG